MEKEEKRIRDREENCRKHETTLNTTSIKADVVRDDAVGLGSPSLSSESVRKSAAKMDGP
jgi:hypothetical protein